VNGIPVRFVVDTGASIVVLRPEDARRAGLAPRAADYTQEANAASGTLLLAPVSIRSLAVGSHVANEVDAAVGDDAMDVSLLGMSYLSRAGRITIEQGRLTIGG
jgi:aspartyl protease family protein